MMLFLASRFVCSGPQRSIMSLLYLHPRLPRLRNLLLIVLQPYQVFSVPPVRGTHILQQWDLPVWHILIDVPVLFPIDDQVLQETPADVADGAKHVIDLGQVLQLLPILGVESPGRLHLVNGFALVNDSHVLILLAALGDRPVATLLVGVETDDCLPVVCKVLKDDVPI